MNIGKKIIEAAVKVLEGRKELIRFALTQRGRKFEGWFKVELAYKLTEISTYDVKLEKKYREYRGRTDIFLSTGEYGCYLEIKFCDTGGNNIKGVLKDIERVRNINEPDIGFVLMVVLPPKRRTPKSLDDVIDRVNKWKTGKLLQVNELSEEFFIEDIGIALFLFGPYQSGKILK